MSQLDRRFFDPIRGRQVTRTIHRHVPIQTASSETPDSA